MSHTYLTTDELSSLIKYDPRTIRERLKDSDLLETVVDGEESYTKTDGSQREIQMSQLVFDALKRQEEGTREFSDYVFCNRDGNL